MSAPPKRGEPLEPSASSEPSAASEPSVSSVSIEQAPPPGPGDPACPHIAREAGVCLRCGHCAHELILNGACYFCDTTDLDPIALSPKKPAVIPAARLVRKDRA